MTPYDFTEVSLNLYALLPEVTLALTALAVIVADWFLPVGQSRRVGFVAVVGLLLALAFGVWGAGDRVDASSLFRGMLAIDGLARFFRFFFIAATLVGVALAMRTRSLERRRMGEFHALMLVATLGMCLLVSSADWLMFVIALETVSLPSYALAGYLRENRASAEASLKYLLYGAAASAVMVFGVSYFYGLSGSTDIRASFGAIAGNEQVYGVALVLVLVGLLFKVAAVPFQFWCPDVYEGAPTPVTAWLSVASKAAGFAALLRILTPLFPVDPAASEPFAAQARALVDFVHLPWLFWVLSAVTMTFGNLAAIKQENVKRLLAYSSIAHAGYLLMAFTALDAPEAWRAMLFYLFIYLLMNFGAFYCVLLIENRTGRADLEAFRGAFALDSPSRVSVSLVVTMTLCLMSLTGIPFLAGFAAKFVLFGALIQKATAMHATLALIGVLNSVVSLYYYFRIVKTMTLEKAEEDRIGRYRLPAFDEVALWATSCALLWFFFQWDGLLRLAEAGRMALASAP